MEFKLKNIFILGIILILISGLFGFQARGESADPVRSFGATTSKFIFATMLGGDKTNSEFYTTTSNGVDDLRRQIDDYSQKIDELEKEKARLNKEIENKQGQAQTLKNEIAKIEARITKLNTDVRITQAKISQSTLSIERLRLEIGDNEKKLNQHRAYLADILRTLHEYENEGELVIFLKNNQFSDFLNQVEYASALEKDLNVSVEEIKSLKTQLENRKVSIESQKQELERQKNNLSQQKNLVANQKDEKGSLLKTTKNQEKIYQNLLSEVERQRRQIELEMYALEDKLRSIVSPGEIPSSRPGMLSWPYEDYRLTQPYGMSNFAKSGAYGGGPHTGIDIVAGYGAPIRAAADGVVKYSGNLGRYSYGNYLMIDHENGLSTLYAHLSSKAAKPGQRAKVGDIIGYEGSTGYSTGSHLHFGVYITRTVELAESKIVKGLMVPTGYHVNPMNYL